MYCHEETNMFYSDYYQTEKYRLEMKEALTKEYYEQLFGWVEVEKIKEKVDEF